VVFAGGRLARGRADGQGKSAIACFGDRLAAVASSTDAPTTTPARPEPPLSTLALSTRRRRMNQALLPPIFGISFAVRDTGAGPPFFFVLCAAFGFFFSLLARI